MQSERFSHARFRPSYSLILFGGFLTVLWLAGGASRADVSGQVAVRGACWILLMIAILFGRRLRFAEERPIALILASAALLAALQLVPLPPDLWQALPGRALLSEAASASRQPQPWRTWSIVPGATVNALSSLVVPLTALILIVAMNEMERKRLPAMALTLVGASMAVGLLQFSGGALSNPFINETQGEVAGTFANRNHFALFLSMGCVLAPVWAFHREGLNWRGPVAISLVLMFILTIMGTGSRAGIVLGAVGIAMGLLIVAKPLRRAFRRKSRGTFIAVAGGGIVMVAALVLASVLTGRTVSIQRMLSTDLAQDMRSRGLPTVLTMTRDYFPWGSGLGGFDSLFRMHEPLSLLKPTYFNHAHNDWLEILLDAGVAGALLLAVAVFWWGWASWKAWRGSALLPKLGSTLILLVLGASAFDYPARTPVIMMMLVLAASWLARTEASDASALPSERQDL